MLTDLILGTAGHIDHGKSSLIQALTGQETAHLPEEKRRGITIEPGYAFLDLPPFRLGVVDVPGHERFVRQMLSGATGMDLVLLVVAADDSIKPQTREHFAILRLLQVPAGVIAITKSDLVEPEWLQLVREEIRAFAQDSFLAQSPLVAVSSRTGEGIAELREALRSAAQLAASSIRQAGLELPFRMAIDRAFPVAGHGTVVTGSVGSGRLAIGETVAIQPSGIEARVRGLNHHGQTVTEVHRGQRAAINLAGVHHGQVRRGDEVSAPGLLKATKTFLAELELNPGLPRPVPDRAQIRLHLGTTDVAAVLRWLDNDTGLPGSSGLAVLHLAEPAVATWNQPLVIRAESPALTLGGGRILHPTPPRLVRWDEADVAEIRRMGSADPDERAAGWAWFATSGDMDAADLARACGVGNGVPHWEALVVAHTVIPIPGPGGKPVHVHAGRLERIEDALRRGLERAHARNPLKLAFPLPAILAGQAHLGGQAVLQQAVRNLTSKKLVQVHQQRISLVGSGPRLTRNERLQLEELLQLVRSAGFQSPTAAELGTLATRSPQSVSQLLPIAIESGELVRIGQDMVMHAETVQEVLARLRDQFPAESGFTVSQLREFLGTSRKYALPFCEHLDESGVTIRDGDLRRFATVAADRHEPE